MDKGSSATTAAATVPSPGHPSKDPISNFFGMPRYQPHMVGRSFDYERKYPSDPLGKEARDEARVWATYLDEAESYDHDMIQSFRDTIDSLLVLAGLFSAVVATFVVQTSQALTPSYAQLALSVQLEQVALLRMGGNVSAMASIQSSNTTVETRTYTRTDLWVNGLFFTSLSLSMATSLLAVLVKQWCQAYVAVTSGSAKDKALTRQFRFDGVLKWKLPEIVGSLPLLLHLAFVVFFAGLSCFVYDLHRSLSSCVIIIMVLSMSGYLGTLVLPALWLECPYRIPLLFKPSRFVVYLFALLRSFLGYAWNEALPRSVRNHLSPWESWHRTQVVSSLKHAEETLFLISNDEEKILAPMLVTARSFSWLFTLSKNKATRRIVTQALYGYLRDNWIGFDTKNNDYHFTGFFSSGLRDFLELTPTSSIAEFALSSVVEIAEVSPHVDEPSLAPLKGLLDVLAYFHTTHNRKSYLPNFLINRYFINHFRRIDVDSDLLAAFFRWGADPNFGRGKPLRKAAKSQNADALKWLLKNGAQVDDYRSPRKYSTTQSLTPLMRGCSLGRLETVNVFIEAGADVNIILPQRDDLPQSPLTMTVMSDEPQSLEVMSLLLGSGARINQGLLNTQDTVLYRAATTGRIDAVSFLLRRGANAKNEWCADPRNIPWKHWVDQETKVEIQELLRAHASQWNPHCLMAPRFDPVLSRHYLA